MSYNIYSNGTINDTIAAEILKFMDINNILNLFPKVEGSDDTVKTVIYRMLEDIGQASLSSALWDPTKVKHGINALLMKRYTSGIQKDISYEDWKTLDKMGGLNSENIAQIAKKPLIQGSHYFFQGYKLLDDLTRANPPYTDQYNWALDVGANSLASTLERPIPVNVTSASPNVFPATSGAWSTYANMNADCHALIAPLLEKGYNPATTCVFYPQNGAGALNRKRASSGDGWRNAFMEFADLGISQDRMIPLENPLAYTRAGANPTRAAFDLFAIDTSSIRIHWPVPPISNVYQDQGTLYPESHIQANMGYVPFFLPKWHVGDQKFYKGVSAIRAINGS